MPCARSGRASSPRSARPTTRPEIVAGDLVTANLMGHDSHGVLRIPQYVKAVRSGGVDATARPRVVSVRGATALVSGEWAFGQLTGRAAMDEAVRLAGEHGVGMVAAVRCAHLGRLGEFVEQAAARGCVGMVWLGGLNPVAVPYRGSRRALGTNPMAIGFPSTEADPVVLDFATTVVAAGKIAAARAAKRRGGARTPGGPRGAADDRSGSALPRGRAAAVRRAQRLRAVGDDRSAGAGTDGRRSSPGSAPRPGRDVRPAPFGGPILRGRSSGRSGPPDDAKATARGILNRLRDVPPAPGFDRVLTPGQPEAITRRGAVQDRDRRRRVDVAGDLRDGARGGPVASRPSGAGRVTPRRGVGRRRPSARRRTSRRRLGAPGGSSGRGACAAPLH